MLAKRQGDAELMFSAFSRVLSQFHLVRDAVAESEPSSEWIFLNTLKDALDNTTLLRCKAYWEKSLREMVALSVLYCERASRETGWEVLGEDERAQAGTYNHATRNIDAFLRILKAYADLQAKPEKEKLVGEIAEQKETVETLQNEWESKTAKGGEWAAYRKFLDAIPGYATLEKAAEAVVAK